VRFENQPNLQRRNIPDAQKRSPLRGPAPTPSSVDRLRDAFFLMLLSSDRQPVVHRDHDYGKWRSGIVGQLGKRAPELNVTSDHRVIVIRSKDHHVRMPMADSRSEMLFCRPHIGKTHTIPLRQFAFGIRWLNTLGDLVRRLALHPKSASQLVIQQYSSGCCRIETNRRADSCVIDSADVG
jgi:hypothetical protein